MPFRYRYFNRDISWLAFNYRVLEEAKDTSLPLYEQMNFLAIYSSNLDEFYRVRVAEYRKASEDGELMDEVSNPSQVLTRINSLVSAQISEVSDIVRNQIVPQLMARNVKLYIGEMPTLEEHLSFIRDYFYHEVIAYLQPVLLTKGTRTFLRDNRPYFALKMYAKRSGRAELRNRRPVYALVKLPLKDPPYYNDLARFVVLPHVDGMRHIMFIDDVIRYNMHELFPGYDIDGMWSVKVARDADLGLDGVGEDNIVETIRHNLSRRSTGVPSSFYHDRDIPSDLLKYLMKTFGFRDEELVESGTYLNLHHFAQFPKNLIPQEVLSPLKVIHPRRLQSMSIFDAIRKSDHVLHYPYQSFDYVIRFLNEAAIDPCVREIKITLYRVATNSAIVNSLIEAAHNNKRVTVFVELKARFDEENNLELAERMKEAGIYIIYSIAGLKVHAKLALVVADNCSYAYLSTGNFNEKTARQYTDHGLFTCDAEIIGDLYKVFGFLEDQLDVPCLDRLLVTQINLKSSLEGMIDREIALAKSGKRGYILLKMNGLQHRGLINKLYEASQAGVKIDLIVRGICCLVPNQDFSRNITVIRIVDRFLEHGRIWVFGNDGENEMYLTSSDLLNRNMKRRIEVAFPVCDKEIKGELLDILDLQLRDNVKSRVIDESLVGNRVLSMCNDKVRAQEDIYKMLLAKEVQNV